MKINHPFKRRIKIMKMKKKSSSSLNLFSTINSYNEPEKSIYLNKSQKIQLNNSSKISSKYLPNGNSLIMNHENLEPSLLFKEIINLKNRINKLKLELLNVNSENRKKDEEIKKVQKILENSKKKLKEKNYLQKLNEQNQMLKLKDEYQKLQEKIKQKEDENKSIFNKLKLIDLEELINDNDKEINIIKEKVDEYKDNLLYNKNLEKKLNFYYFYKEQFFQNHKYIVSVIKQVNSKSNTINLLKENLKKLKDKYYEMNENKKKFVTYNDSIQKNNEKLLIDKNKRDNFLKKKPKLIEKIKEFKKKANDLVKEEISKKDEINYIENNKNKKEEEPKKKIYKIVIKKNPNERINQKIKLLESLIRESKERQKEFIDLFEYYNDYIKQKENYENEVNLFENKNKKKKKAKERNEKSGFIDSSNSTNRKNDIIISDKKDEKKEFDNFKYLLSIIFYIQKVPKDKIEKILLNFRTQNYYLGNLNDKNNYLLKLSKEILNLIKDKNENDINLLKDLLIYLFNEKYKSNKNSFLDNIIKDFIEIKALTNIIKEENKLYEKIKQEYFNKANSIKDKIKKINTKLISYEKIKKIFEDEKLYINNNEEKIILFKSFIYILKRYSSYFNNKDSITDFISNDIIKFFNDELKIKKEKEDENLNEEEISLSTDKYKNIVNSFIKRFNKFLNEKKINLKQFIGDNNVSSINIYNFFNLLKQNKIDIDKLTISCLLEKYKKEEGSENIDVNSFEKDLNN